MNIIIRPEIIDDLLRIAEMTRDLTIHNGAFQWSVENHLKHVKRRYLNSRYIHIVALVNKRIVGFTGAELKSTRTAYILKGFVEPDFRRKGKVRKSMTWRQFLRLQAHSIYAKNHQFLVVYATIIIGVQHDG